ncbi:Lipoyl synthase [Chlamydiales bacterium STE3]|nr:Lipoyl synthase [Chlamydiales bacterium STE3]
MDEQIFDHRPKVKKLNVLPNHHEENNPLRVVGSGRFPSWLHRKLPKGGNLWQTDAAISQQRLATVCEEAKCPNRLECWTKKTATFLTMGKQCTRSCGFCSIAHAKAPPPLEKDEPARIAESVRSLGLKHVVLTQVARDDLPDGGAEHLALIIEEIRKVNQEATIEILTSDFDGNQHAWQTILEAKPEIFNYNIETVKALTPRVRHKATYKRTLDFLSFLHQYRQGTNLFIKSGLMVGLGENKEEVFETLHDLKKAGCDIITIGQYLQSNSKKLLVKRFVTPEEFKEYEEYGYAIGVRFMYAGPFVRSSYNADHVIQKLKES